MKEFKGYGGGKVVIDGNNVFIKQLFVKETCTFDDIKSVELVEPTLTKNGSLQITTSQQVHIIFFLSSGKEKFMELFKIFQEHLPATQESNFHATKVIGNFMQIDDVNKLVQFRQGILQITKKYDDILDFEVIEDSESIIKGGAGKALVGGLLFGSTGAVIGSTGKKKSTSIVQKVEVIIRLNDMKMSTVSIPIITSPVKKSSATYSLNMRIVEDMISSLSIMTNRKHSKTAIEETTEKNTLSSADEILKFKQLLDAGIITQQEFDAKKKQLLGL